VLLLFLGESLNDTHGRHGPLHHRVDFAFLLTSDNGSLSYSLTHEGNGKKQERADGQSQQGELPIEPHHDEKHPAQQHNGSGNGKNPIHSKALDGVGVRRDPIEQIAYLPPTVKSQGQTLQVAVDVAAHIVDHHLTDLDGGIVVQECQSAKEEVDCDHCEAGEEQDRFGSVPFSGFPGQRLIAENIIDDNLKRPWFQKFAAAYEKHLRQGDQKRDTIRPEIIEGLCVSWC